MDKLFEVFYTNMYIGSVWANTPEQAVLIRAGENHTPQFVAKRPEEGNYVAFAYWEGLYDDVGHLWCTTDGSVLRQEEMPVTAVFASKDDAKRVMDAALADGRIRKGMRIEIKRTRSTT